MPCLVDVTLPMNLDYFGFPISPTPKQQALSFREEARSGSRYRRRRFLVRMQVALAAIDRGQFAFTPWTD